MSDRQQVDISTGSVFRALLLVLAAVLLYQLAGVLIVLLFAIIIASAIQPFVSWFEKRRVPRLVGVLLLYLMVFAVVVILERRGTVPWSSGWGPRSAVPRET